MASPRGQRTANPARIYDYLLGGTDNTRVERRAGDQLMAAKPGLRANVRANRRFLARAVRYLAGQGVTQFLDIGTGLPTMDNTHEVAQRASPAARVAYVDNDPIVVTTARALLVSSPQGHVDFLQLDLRYPGIILNRARDVLDFTRPVAIMLLGILYMIPDEQDPWRIVSALTGALPPAATWPSRTRPATSAPRNQPPAPTSTGRRPASPRPTAAATRSPASSPGSPSSLRAWCR